MKRIFEAFDRAFEPIIEWLFATKTRAVEVFNGALFAAWGIAVVADNSMLRDATFDGFTTVHPMVMAVVFLVMAEMSLMGVMSSRRDGRFLGGYSLFLSSFIWALVGAGFIASYPPLTPAMVLYPLLSLLCFLFGRKIIKDNVKQRQK